jgi:DNA-binding FrmR family transcriptional regulator
MPTGSTIFLVFTGVVTFAVVLQTLVLLAVLVAAKAAQRKAMEEVERLQGQMRPLLQAIDSVSALIEDLNPQLRAVVANVQTASERLRDQVEHIDSVVGDVTGKTRRQVSRIDTMITDTLDAVASGTRVIQDNVMAPIRQVGGWMSAIRSGMDILRGGGTGERRTRRSQRAERNFG